MPSTPDLYRAGSGPQVLLLHGFTGSWLHWKPVLAELAARYDVVAPTLAGHDGGPPLHLHGGPALLAAADHLEGHLDELGVRDAHVVGNSMGGSLALELAKRGRVSSVLAIAPGGGWTQGDGTAQAVGRFFARQTRAAKLAGPRAAGLMRRPVTRRAAFRDVMRFGDLLAPADAVDMLQASNRCTVVRTVLKALRADDGVTVEDLDRIAVPVLVATPEHDRILLPARNTERFRREIPGVEHVVLPGVGHVPMWDDTRLVTRTIVEWVDRQASTS